MSPLSGLPTGGKDNVGAAGHIGTIEPVRKLPRRLAHRHAVLAQEGEFQEPRRFKCATSCRLAAIIGMNMNDIEEAYELLENKPHQLKTVLRMDLVEIVELDDDDSKAPEQSLADAVKDSIFRALNIHLQNQIGFTGRMARNPGIKCREHVVFARSEKFFLEMKEIMGNRWGFHRMIGEKTGNAALGKVKLKAGDF